VGGPGSEFVSGGRNWPIAPEDEKQKQERRYLYGNWRVEIRPPEPAEIDRFLVFIQVAKADGANLVKAETVPGEAPALRFAFDNNTFTVAFKPEGSAGGSLTINGQTGSLPETVTDPLTPDGLQALTRKARELRR